MPILKRLNQLLDGRFNTARWEDLKPNLVSVGAGSAALTRKAIRLNAPIYDHFVSNQDDALIFSFQTEHGWDKTIVRPHVHSMPTSAATGAPTLLLGNVYWLFRWTWTGYRSGLKLPVGSSWSSQYITQPITVADQFEEIISGPTITPPDGLPLSAHLHVELSRLGTNGNDTYETAAESGSGAANLALISVDCHVRRNRMGSKNEMLDY